MADRSHKSYWKTNLKYLAALLAVWLAVSAGLSIILADWLDQFRLGGFGLGFWFSQQGSILVFVILIFVYVGLMNRLDRRHDVDDRQEGLR
jgi:putative solute:sodium symporter small subunit